MEKFTEIYFGISGAAEAVIGYHYFSRLTGKKTGTYIRTAAALLIVTVMQLCFGAVNSVIGIISPAMIGKDPDITAAAMILFDLISLFTACVFCENIIKCFSGKIFDVKKNLPDGSLFFIPLLMIFGTGLYIDHIFYGNTVSKDRIEMISGKSPAMFIFQVLGISSVFCIIRICCEFIKNRIWSEYAELRAKNAEFRFGRTKAFRHDVKNHIAVLTGLLD